MKKYIILFLAFFTFSNLNAQDWQWQNPLPQGNALSSVYFTNSYTGYAVGNAGTILKTINGGMNWFALFSGTNNNLNSVCFTDFNTGYVVGDGGTILTTAEGGTDFIAGSSLIPNTFNFYPNPSKEIITVELSKSTNNTIGSISIYGIMGQELIQQKCKAPNR